MQYIQIKLLNKNAKVPERCTHGSVGYDICAAIEESVTIMPGETKIIPSGFAMSLEQGYGAFLYARSSLGIKHNIVPANCVGVIDSDYRGEVKVGLLNESKAPYTVAPNDRIAQMVIAKCELPELLLCDDLDETERGAGGLGSTGKSTV